MQSHLNEDQGKSSRMEDSTAMTIEFLRARLLSERSVSKTARQRADELAKRVVELEEQLKIVTLQRKKAEKATADVLAILENHGLSDVSDAFDSSSDREVTPCESKVSNNSAKEEEGSVNSKVRRNDVDDISSSELESSQIPGRSLSWKSCKESPHSHQKKCMGSSVKRRNGFASTGYSSPKHRQGKSCRQIRRREMRPVSGDRKVDSVMLDAQENGAASCSEGFPNCSDDGSEILKEFSENREENQRNETGVGLYLNEHVGDRDMERALEHQAQLIGQYEAEEKAQREWEEKFKENNSCSPDSCEPGNHSDVTEERDDCKAQSPYSTGTFNSKEKELNLKGEVPSGNELAETHLNGFQPPSHVDLRLQELERSRRLGDDPPASGFAFPMTKDKQSHKLLENHFSYPSSDSSHHLPHSQGLLEDQSANSVSTSAESNLGKVETSGSQNQLSVISNERPDDHALGAVLGALQQAKLSLKQKLNRLTLLEGGPVGKAIEPCCPVSGGDRVDFPVGCAHLFRIPTDFQFESNPWANAMGSGSRLSLTNYSPDKGLALTAADRFLASPLRDTQSSAFSDGKPISSSLYADSGSRISTQKSYFNPSMDRGVDHSGLNHYTESQLGVSASNPVISRAHVEGGSKLSTQRPYFDPYPDTGLPSSGRFTYPSFPDLMHRLPINEGFSRPFRSRTVEMPPAEHFSFYDDHIRPNMYR